MNRNLSTSSLSLASTMTSGTWFVLDVAGKEYKTMKNSLSREPNSFLARIIDENLDPDQLVEETDGKISYDSDSVKWLIDGNAEYFEYIVKYLRTGKFNDVKPGHSLEDLVDEAELFRLQNLVDICKQRIHDRNLIQQQLRSGISTPISPTHSIYYPSQQHFVPPPPGIPLNARPHCPSVEPPPGFEPIQQQPPFFHRPSNSEESHSTEFSGNSSRSSQFHDAQLPIEKQSTIYSTPLPNLPEESWPLDDPDQLKGLSAFSMPPQEEKVNLVSDMEEELEHQQAAEEEGGNIWAEEADEMEKEDGELSVSEEDQNMESDVDEAYDARCDVGSTIFEPPVPCCQLIDTNVDKARPMVFAFELLDGRVHNYKRISQRRQEITQKFLNSLALEIRPEHLDVFGPNTGHVVFFLQRLCMLYPNGCKVKEYVDFEQSMKLTQNTHNGQVVHFGNFVPTVVHLLHGKLLKIGQSGKIEVAEEVSKIHLFLLRQNLCSNLFRFLNRQQGKKAMIKDVLIQMQTIVSDKSSMPSFECLLSTINRFPAIFQLISDPKDNFQIDSSWMCLNEELLNNENLSWRVVLDCDVPNSKNWCDCSECCRN